MSVAGEPRDDVAVAGADHAPAGSEATVGAWARQRETAEHGGMLWLGLVVGLFLLLPAATPRTGVVFWGIVLFVTLLVSLRYRIGPAALVIMVVAGVTVRLVLIGTSSSDALIVTVAAIERVLAGGSLGRGLCPDDPPGTSPYGPWRSSGTCRRRHCRKSWRSGFDDRPDPAGHPRSPGRPGHLRLRADAHRPRHGRLERLLGGLASPRRILVMQRSRAWGGAALAGAAAFKIYALAWLPALLWFGRLPALGALAWPRRHLAARLRR